MFGEGLDMLLFMAGIAVGAGVMFIGLFAVGWMMGTVLNDVIEGKG